MIIFHIFKFSNDKVKAEVTTATASTAEATAAATAAAAWMQNNKHEPPLDKSRATMLLRTTGRPGHFPPLLIVL